MMLKFPYQEGSFQRLKNILRTSILLILVFFNYTAHSQEWEHPFINYTIKDGLPSNEVYDVIQDSIGFIWLTTDNGFCRFDGYEFKTYGLEKGLTDRVVFDMQLDKYGRIWMNSISGKIFYYSPHLDSIIDDPFINFEKNNVKGVKPNYFYDNDKNTLIVSYWFGKYGSLYKFKFDTKKIESNNNSNVWLTKNGNQLRPNDKVLTKFTEYLIIDDDTVKLHPKLNKKYEKVNDYFINLFPFGKSFIYSSSDYALLIDKNNQLIISREKINDVDILIDSNIYISYDDDKGLKRYKGLNNFISDKSQIILNNITASNYFSTKYVNWVTSPRTGLYKLHNNLYEFRKTQTNDINKSIYFNSNIYIFFKNQNIGVLNPIDGKFKLIDVKNKKIVKNASIIYNKLFITKINGRNSIFKNNQFYDVEGRDLQGLDINTTLFGHKLFESIDTNYIFATNGTGLIKYNRRTKIWVRINKARAHNLLLTKSKKTILATTNGLYTLEHDSFKDEMRHLHPYLKRRIDYLLELEDSTLVFASRNEGIYLLKNGKVSHTDIYYENKLNSIKGLHLFNNEVWINTSAGIIVVEIKNNKIVKKTFINSLDGLPNEEINDIVFTEKEVYLIYLNSIIKFNYTKNQHNNSINVTPLIQSLKINNLEYKVKDTMVLSHFQNNLTLKLLAFDYRQNGQIYYQYSINNKDYIDLGKQRVINLFQLAPDNYTLKIRTRNTEMEWGIPKHYYITILPPWWRTWWFFSLIGISFIGITFLVFKRREKNIKQIANFKDEINSLEKTALQAQMNPHFIFNSLNSIQKFILTNDKEIASEYLSKFARLIRLNLNASKSELIFLKEELDQIMLYLELEKLRFKNKFEYVINIDNSIFTTNIKIPPMILQPIIENSIIHGFSKINYQGLITIKIEKSDTELEIQIVDNGRGLTNNVKNNSMGTSITKKRIELISKNSSSNFSINNIYNEKSEIIGVKCIIHIPLMN